MTRHLTEIDEPMTILSAGETDAGSAEVQPIRLRSGQALSGIARPRRRIVVGMVD